MDALGGALLRFRASFPRFSAPLATMRCTDMSDVPLMQHGRLDVAMHCLTLYHGETAAAARDQWLVRSHFARARVEATKGEVKKGEIQTASTPSDAT